MIAERFGICRELLRNLEATAEDHTVVRFPSSTMYLFSSGKTFWIVDPAFNYFDCKKEDPELDEIARLISEKVSVIAITHLHEDHCQIELVKRIKNPAVKWVVSSRFADEFQARYGVAKEQIVILNDGESFEYNGIRFTIQLGYHQEPGKPEFPACSYNIELPDGVKLFMPADVRAFQREIPDMSPVDYIFGHVFLGREDAQGDEFSKLQDFCNFMTRRKSREIILAHLYELGRASRDLWTHRHAEMVRAELKKIAPEIKVHAPHFGDILHLTGE